MRARSILGSDTFGDWVKREFLLKSPLKDRREQRELASHHGCFTLPAVVAAVACVYGMHAPALYRRGCRNRVARQLAMLAASRHSRGTTSMTDVAHKFGITHGGLVLAVIRTEEKLAASPQLRKYYQSIQEMLSPSKTA